MGWGEAIARLQHFYGGNPAGWLNDVPIALVWAYLEMLPRLHAERQLEGVRMGWAMNGRRYEDATVQDIEDELKRTAFPNARPPRAAKATLANLASMGIGVVSAPDKGALSDV